MKILIFATYQEKRLQEVKNVLKQKNPELYRDYPEVRPPCEKDHGLIRGETAP